MQSSGGEGAPLITAGQPHGSGTKCHQVSALEMMLINTAALCAAEPRQVPSAPLEMGQWSRGSAGDYGKEFESK